MASARNLPTSASPLAEMVPTWAISSFEVTFLEFFSRSATTASTARSIPRFRSIGFMPAATDLAPSRTIAAASTVAVVVPSRPRSLASRRSRHRPQRWGQNSQRNLYNYTSPVLYKSHLYKPQLYKLICIARYTNSGSRPAAIGWHRSAIWLRGERPLSISPFSPRRF